MGSIRGDNKKTLGNIEMGDIGEKFQAMGD